MHFREFKTFLQGITLMGLGKAHIKNYLFLRGGD